MFGMEKDLISGNDSERIMPSSLFAGGSVFGTGNSMAQEILDDTISLFESLAVNMGMIAGLRDE